jgi:hypothetical protein
MKTGEPFKFDKRENNCRYQKSDKNKKTDNMRAEVLPFKNKNSGKCQNVSQVVGHRIEPGPCFSLHFQPPGNKAVGNIGKQVYRKKYNKQGFLSRQCEIKKNGKNQYSVQSNTVYNGKAPRLEKFFERKNRQISSVVSVLFFIHLIALLKTMVTFNFR